MPPATAACPATPGAPGLSSLPVPANLTQLAQQLAIALNLQPSTVQQALSTEGAALSATLPQPTDPLAGAAAQLGVSEQKLMVAVQSADAALGPNLGAGAPGGNAVVNVTGGGAGGSGNGPVLLPSGEQGGGSGAVAIAFGCSSPAGSPTGGPSVNPATFFADVAQQLGSTFTGPQVQAAFQGSAPTPPAPGAIQSVVQQQASSLATALGVTPDALTSALSSIGYPNGCLPVVPSGNVSIKPPSLPGSGPLFIPLGAPGGTVTGQVQAIGFMTSGPAGGNGNGPVASGPGTNVAVMCAVPAGSSGQLTQDGS